jgi:acetyltransferase-like isoleucine patch superfamily enzyme
MSGRAPAQTVGEPSHSGSGIVHRPGRGRLLALAVTALLPGPLKKAVYRRVFRYKIGKGVRIGLSLVDAAQCTIEDDVSIGHGNLILGVARLRLGDHTRIGYGNILRGGESVDLDRYSEIIRFNVINAIPDNDCISDPVSRFTLGAGSVVTSGHRFDFTDTIDIGKRTIIGGRNSSFWTHNRQKTRPIRVGDFVYMGSEVRAAPGVEIPPYSIVGLGSVLIGRITEPHSLISGFPATVIRPLTEDDEFLVTYRTRRDLPEDV